MTRLSESIVHIEDLPIDEFIRTLQNMNTMVAQEKLDGANLWVGIDEDGKLFTSREGKRGNAERRYSEEEWPKVSAFNQFRAAQAALQSKEQEIKRIMRPGDMVEAEVLFGRQPNSVTYGAGGKSYIAFLRAVNDTPDTIADQLSSSLANQQADAKLKLVDTSDGTDLSMRETDVSFQFIAAQRMDAAKLKNESGVDPLLKKLQTFLKQDSAVAGYTNQMLATLSLNTVPKEEREAIKQARIELLAQLQTEYKLPIKNALLSKAGTKSGLAADDITPDEDVGIEGIVLRDPSTGKQVKVVDKDIFTAINRFNQSMRGEVQSALNSTDPDAPLESRGGLLGALRIEIAAALGNRELAKPSNVRKLLEPLKGGSPEEAIKNFAKSLNIDDFVGVKKKILALAANTAKKLNEKLEFFKENKENYRLKLKNGKEIGLSDETIKKTLLSFAEARRNLVELFDKLKLAKTPASMLAVLYGNSARAVHQTEGLTEEMLLEKRRDRTGEISTSDFERKDTFQLVNSYMSTVMMAMIIYHADDTIGMRYLRDRKNYLMRSHNDDMSPLNHWGFVIWRTGKPDLKKHVMKSAISELTRVTKKIPTPWWKYLHMDFSYDKKVKVDWGDHKRTLNRLLELSGLRTERLNTLLDLSVRFDELELKEQKHAVKMLQAFAYRFVPRSRLLSRIRVIANGLKDAKEPIVTEGLLRKIAALSEEGEAAVDGTEVNTTVNGASSGTAAGAISSLPTKIFGGARKTVMMKRNKNPQFARELLKFKDTRKP
jgi:hypothetical protein